VRPAVTDSGDTRLADIPRSVEIGLADLEMDDVSPLGLEGAGADEDFKRRFCPETLHSGRESHLTPFCYLADAIGV
jgi:hypothetical protein